MILISPDASRELKAIAADGGPSVLQLDAQPDGEGAFDCSVALVEAATDGAELEDVDGVTVAFLGKASGVFAGAIVGVSPEGDLMVELAEGDCSGCGEHGEGGCDCGGSCNC